jgi:methylmalonyl-CoA mutase N-terminal domain/subunit
VGGILLIDAEQPFADQLTGSLTGRGFSVKLLDDGKDGLDYARDLGDPGAFPYTRGIHASGYTGKPWTMRQFAGFGTPEDTNTRFKFLLASGQVYLRAGRCH